VGGGDGPVVEANPLAGAVLGGYGWWGLACYKVATVGFVLALGWFIGSRRPASARRLWQAACVILLVLVTYQLGLAAVQPWDKDARRTVADQALRPADVDRQWLARREFERRLRARMAAAWGAGRGGWSLPTPPSYPGRPSSHRKESPATREATDPARAPSG
jgi:hypothetical protein